MISAKAPQKLPLWAGNPSWAVQRTKWAARVAHSCCQNGSSAQSSGRGPEIRASAASVRRVRMAALRLSGWSCQSEAQTLPTRAWTGRATGWLPVSSSLMRPMLRSARRAATPARRSAAVLRSSPAAMDHRSRGAPCDGSKTWRAAKNRRASSGSCGQSAVARMRARVFSKKRRAFSSRRAAGSARTAKGVLRSSEASCAAVVSQSGARERPAHFRKSGVCSAMLAISSHTGRSAAGMGAVRPAWLPISSTLSSSVIGWMR